MPERFAILSRRAAAGLAAAALVALATPRRAWACTCVRLAPADAFKRAGAVFAGTVVESHPVASPAFHDAAETRVTVDQVFRGEPGAEVVIGHGTDMAACGVWFDPGDRMVFFTDEVVDGRTRTSYCSMLYAERYAQGLR